MEVTEPGYEDEGTFEEVEEYEGAAGVVTDTEDGGAMVELEDEVDAELNAEHFANIVDDVDEKELKEIVDDLIDKIGRDKKAREKRDELYEEGIRRTGLSEDAPGGASFTGATRVVHPLLVEACVDFSARVIKELLPSQGPVKSKIIGTPDEAIRIKAQNKTEYLNWQLMEQMKEFRSEMEQLTTQVPLGGVQYLKLYFNPRKRRPVSEFAPVDDMLLPFAASSFHSAERKTHVQYVTAMEFNNRVSMGMYKDLPVGLTNPEDPDYTKSSLANDKVEGRDDDGYNEDGLRTIYEVYTCFDIGEGHLPYIISIDKSTEEPVALYRNWDKDDESQEELEWIIEFPCIPWRGAYPIGLTHMIGSLAAASTGALRALLDSAHISNIPTMLKLKGGPGGQTINLQPTEVVEIEGGIGVDDIRKIAMPLPFNPPSQVLFQLLGFLVDAGRGVIQTSFEKLSDTSQQQPVGTTMALIEQGMAVFSSIHSRLHASMSRVLKVLHRINSAYLTKEDIERQFGRMIVEPGDFDGPMDVIPVSDPHIFSETQRFAQVQAIMQRAQAVPDLYDVRKTEEMFLRQMKIKPEDVLRTVPGKEDMDPISENVAATMGVGVYVLPKQNHAAHLQVHLTFLQSSMFGQHTVMRRSLLPLMLIHLRDHLLNYYLTQTQEAVKLATDEAKIQDGDEQQEAAVIVKTQEIIETQFQPLVQVLTQLEEAAKAIAAEESQQVQDPSIQIAQMNVDLQKSMQQMTAQIDQMKLQSQSEKDKAELEFKQMKLQIETQVEKAKLAQKVVEISSKLDQDTKIKREDMENKEAMNASDNATALVITDAKIAAGMTPKVTTGTGINP